MQIIMPRLVQVFEGMPESRPGLLHRFTDANDAAALHSRTTVSKEEWQNPWQFAIT